jgi:hypothetical protein
MAPALARLAAVASGAGALSAALRAPKGPARPRGRAAVRMPQGAAQGAAPLAWAQPS